MSKLIIGIVGDDFTGSSDAASFMAKSGLKTMLFDGVPDQMDLDELGVQAAVIALKSRMAPVEEAKASSLAAAKWLKDHGAAYIYSKYCSTFDSTPKGNIGPILDNMLDNFQAQSSFICPGLPVNGRIVRDGILYINGTPIAESPMKNHPLTPIWDSSLKVLMEAQSKYPCFIITGEQLRDEAKLKAALAEISSAHEHFYIVPDYADEEDAKLIAKYFGDMPVQSGGSGILTELGKKYLTDRGLTPCTSVVDSKTTGRALLLAGSCSVATQAQIKDFAARGNATVKIDCHQLMQGSLSAAELFAQCADAAGNVLIYSTAPADEVKVLQEQYGRDELAARIELMMTELTKLAFAAGFTRYIIAGGETSGAVMRALPADGYLIGESVAPGVPIMIPSRHLGHRLVLKSGNFGSIDFFTKALEMTGI